MEETLSSEMQCSLELSQNGKGARSWKVKVYEDDPKALEAKLAKYIDIAEKYKGMEDPS